MTKLNELAPREGSTKNRMRVGRGPGEGLQIPNDLGHPLCSLQRFGDEVDTIGQDILHPQRLPALLHELPQR